MDAFAPPTRRRAVRRLAQAGFSLVEVMVGLALGMVIMVALVALIFNVNRNNLELARTNSVIENGRFALQVLESDVVHAGYWANWVPQFDDLSRVAGSANPDTLYTNDAPVAVSANAPDPCTADPATWTDDYKNQLIGIGIQSHKVVSGLIYSDAAATTQLCSGVINAAAKAKSGTDVLVVRHVAPCAATATATDSDCRLEASKVYLQVDRCFKDDYSDTLQKTLAVSADATLSNFLGRNRGCNTAITASPSTVAFGTATSARPYAYKYISMIYYVRTWAVTDGDGIPTLVRRKFDGGTWGDAEALVEGIEDMRVELGLDSENKDGTALAATVFNDAPAFVDASRPVTPTNRGDGNADTFKHCGNSCTAFELTNAVVARVYVLARARTTTPGHEDSRDYKLGANTVTAAGDAYKRQVYTRTVRLTNVSMRREVPSGS